MNTTMRPVIHMRLSSQFWLADYSRAQASQWRPSLSLAAARPDVDPRYKKYCVQCLPSYVDSATESTYLIPAEPKLLDASQRFDTGLGAGLAFNGVRFDGRLHRHRPRRAESTAPARGVIDRAAEAWLLLERLRSHRGLWQRALGDSCRRPSAGTVPLSDAWLISANELYRYRGERSGAATAARCSAGSAMVLINAMRLVFQKE